MSGEGAEEAQRKARPRPRSVDLNARPPESESPVGALFWWKQAVCRVVNAPI